MLNYELNSQLTLIENIGDIGRELEAMTNRRLILLNELNDLARKLDYSVDNYDENLAMDDFLTEIAYISDLSYEGHRPGKACTFWIPSSRNC